MTKEEYIKKIKELELFYPTNHQQLNTLNIKELKEIFHILCLKIARATICFI